MLEIDPSIMVHRLNVSHSVLLIRKKKRVFAQERDKAITKEFIKEVYYLDWLVNVVMVKKANGTNSYPLSQVDILVDSTARHQLLSFMDAFSSYNQIKLDEADQEKTSFVTSQGLFCYKVMTFGLKNAGATYQRLMSKMFAH